MTQSDFAEMLRESLPVGTVFQNPGGGISKVVSHRDGGGLLSSWCIKHFRLSKFPFRWLHHVSWQQNVEFRIKGSLACYF